MVKRWVACFSLVLLWISPGWAATDEPVDLVYLEPLRIEHIASLRSLVGDLRRQVWQRPKDPEVNRALADAAIAMAREIEILESIGRDKDALGMAHWLGFHLAGTDRHLEYMSGQGNVDAIATRAMMARLGVVLDRDKETACGLYAEAALQSHIQSAYQYALCIAGEDRDTSVAWLEKAAESGHAGAQELVARMCLEREDFACARRLLCPAASLGRASAMTLLAWIYASSQPKFQDLERAFFLYNQAARLGDVQAQNNLGEAYERGWIDAADPERAMLWYRRAARSGSSRARLNLARLLTKGHGSVQEEGMATHWLELSAGRGMKQARDLLEQLKVGSGSGFVESMP